MGPEDNRMSERGEWYLIGILATLAFLCFLIVIVLCIAICKRLGGRRSDDSRYGDRNRPGCNTCYTPQNPYPHYWPREEPRPFTTRHPVSQLLRYNNPVFIPEEPIRAVEVNNPQSRVAREEERWSHTSIEGEAIGGHSQSSWRDTQNTTDRSITKMVGDKLVVYITKSIGHIGGFLVLDNMGISVEVPQGAVNVGETKDITLLLNWDLGDNPEMQSSQALVSPVVFVGPHGMTLNKPCVLSYMHCSFDSRHIQVMKSETDLFSAKKWEVMCKPNDTNGSCVLTTSTCQLNINTFTLYTCLQCPPAGELGRKWLQIAVFSEGIKPGIEHQQVRVYFLNKTNCALQWAIHNEAQYGGKLICPEKLFLLSGTEKDVFVVITYVSRGWTLIDNSRQDRIPYLNIWHGQCPHVNVGFRRENPSMHEFNLNLDVKQDGRENESERIIAQIVQPEVAPPEVAQPDQVAISTPVPRKRTIPQCLRTRLQVLLDVTCPLAQNWKGLAEKIGYDGMIPFLESRIGSSPTEVLLQAMEQKAYTLQELQRILGEMGRTDAVNAIHEYVEPSEEPDTMLLKPCREAVENENVGHASSDQPLNEF